MLDAESAIIGMLAARAPALEGRVYGFGARPGELKGRPLYATVLITSSDFHDRTVHTLGLQRITWMVTLRGENIPVRTTAYALPDALRGWYSTAGATIQGSVLTGFRPPAESAESLAESRLTFTSDIGG